jgi:hypothetical protein
VQHVTDAEPIHDVPVALRWLRLMELVVGLETGAGCGNSARPDLRRGVHSNVHPYSDLVELTLVDIEHGGSFIFKEVGGESVGARSGSLS